MAKGSGKPGQWSPRRMGKGDRRFRELYNGLSKPSTHGSASAGMCRLQLNSQKILPYHVSFSVGKNRVLLTTTFANVCKNLAAGGDLMRPHHFKTGQRNRRHVRLGICRKSAALWPSLNPS
jgi:hypothetical protein